MPGGGLHDVPLGRIAFCRTGSLGGGPGEPDLGVLPAFVGAQEAGVPVGVEIRTRRIGSAIGHRPGHPGEAGLAFLPRDGDEGLGGIRGGGPGQAQEQPAGGGCGQGPVGSVGRGGIRASSAPANAQGNAGDVFQRGGMAPEGDDRRSEILRSDEGPRLDQLHGPWTQGGDRRCHIPIRGRADQRDDA